MHLTSRLSSSVSVVALTGLLAGAATALGASPAAATPDDTVVTFTGHGWGHGRGMGQYGALGYAVNHGAGWQDILRHYYRDHRVASDAGNEDWLVRLTEWDGRELLAYSRGGVLTVPNLLSGVKAVRVRRTAPGWFEVSHAPGCGGPWTRHATFPESTVTVHSASDATYDSMVGVCEVGQSRAYRGELVAVDAGSRQTAVNRVRVESYLRGVVPRESPASWGDLGGGRGMNALRAQAVAARSYALAEDRTGYEKTCDTVACQVYRGAAVLPFGSSTVSPLEDPRTDRAIHDTAGTVMRNSQNRFARTEFSSSTGGWTAGGVFPAVVDDGDAISNNPNHNWSTQLTEGVVASRLGVPDVRSFDVVERNGLGADGGRIVSVVVDTGASKVTFTGGQLRSRLGLKSDWFLVSGLPTTATGNYVSALYPHFLGRPVDPAGLDFWSRQIASGRMSRTQVALELARTEEWIGRIVDDLYRKTLGRAADEGGRRFWIQRIQEGMSVADVAAQFYASQEYFLQRGSDVGAWVDDLYLKLLGRRSDPEGRQNWITLAQQRGREYVALNFYQSLESRLVRVEALYQLLLGRSADPAGRQTWAEVILQQGDIVLAASLAGSQEYFERAQNR